MVYILSRYHLGLQYTLPETQAAARRFLKKNMDNWLSNGHWNRAAEWMKILYWNDGDRVQPAKDVLMKCYDFLPGRRPPEP